jgi:hypothetical protein
MKIVVNDSFRSAALKRFFANLSNSQDSISVKMFDGVMPTYAEVKAFADTAGYSGTGDLNSGQFIAQLEGAGYTNLFDIQYLNMTQRRQTTFTRMDFFFSKRAESSFGLDDGKTATWFWLYQHNDNAPTSWNYWNLFGTIGLVDSGADIELVDNVISTTQSYKVNDINLNFNINPTAPAAVAPVAPDAP